MFLEHSYDSSIHNKNSMNPFNKYEAIGMFLSVAVMAVALSILRFETDVFALNDINPSETQGAVVAVSQDEGSKKLPLEEALTQAFSGRGELIKLVVDDVRVGTGAEVKNGDTLTVQYIGTTQDGVKFDSSYDRGEPFIFRIGAGQVIQGWEKGLIGMKVGGQRVLVIPSDMGYGNRQVGPIAPNTPLVFAVELVSIK
jgi:FKBP-type peptidyl-prolyl cis-trans isomerase